MRRIGTETGDEVWWINAADPASLCGIDIAALKGVLPSRLSSTHVVFHGSAVVLVSRRRGLDLEFRVPPDSPRMAEYLAFVKVLTGRDARPMTRRARGDDQRRAGALQPVQGPPPRGGFVEDYRRLT